MGFLSRKSRPEEESQVESQETPQSGVETIEPTPEEGGEIKISKASEHEAATDQTDAQQGGHHPDAPGREAEEAAGIDSEPAATPETVGEARAATPDDGP